MKTIRIVLVFLCFFVGSAFHLSAQETKDTLTSASIKYKVTKNDGTVFIGYLLKNDAREVLIKTDELGEVYIPKHEIKSIEKYDEISETQKEKEANRNLLPSRYIQTTNGFPVKKGEGYAKFMLSGIDFQFAITEKWSLGGMSSWSGIPIILTTKYSQKFAPKVHASIGLLYGNLLYGSSIFNDGGIFTTGGGILFANLTFGSEEANINFSGGYGFTHFQETTIYWDVSGNPISDTRMQADGTALFSIAAMKRISKQAMFVFDSVISFNEFADFFLFAPAIRYMPKPSNIFQFGIGMGIIDGQFLPIPMPMVSFYKVFKKTE